MSANILIYLEKTCLNIENLYMRHEVKKNFLTKKFEKLYREFNRRDLVSPDPLQFLYEYNDARDREVVGLIASSLAYGRVAQIIKSTNLVLKIMGKSPHEFLKASPRKQIEAGLKDFKHRFTVGNEVANLLFASKKAISEFGSIGECFSSFICKSDENILSALSKFIEKFSRYCESDIGYLLPSPEKGSACKRPNLYLRWMVRSDDVDPGGWSGISASKLIIPLDTHMYNICRRFGFTKRKQANLKTACEITENFKKIAPDDPVKYDFALTRFGIRGDMKIEDLF